MKIKAGEQFDIFTPTCIYLFFNGNKVKMLGQVHIWNKTKTWVVKFHQSFIFVTEKDEGLIKGG